MCCHGNISPFVAYLSSVVTLGILVVTGDSSFVQCVVPDRANDAIRVTTRIKRPQTTAMTVALPFEHTNCLHLCFVDGS